MALPVPRLGSRERVPRVDRSYPVEILSDPEVEAGFVQAVNFPRHARRSPRRSCFWANHLQGGES